MYASFRSARTAVLLALVLALAPASSVFAATILIDFNDNSTAGFGWNVLHTGNDGTTIDLISDDGSDSGIDLATPTFNDSANAGWNGANPLPSWAPTSVANDYSFINNFFDGGTGTAQFVLSNLDASSLYAIDIISSRNLNRDQDITVTHGGGVEFHDNWNTRRDGWRDGNVLMFSNLSSDLSDEIVIDISREGASAAFNAIRITSVPVPEPNLALLVGLGLGFMSIDGRERSRHRA